MGSLAGSEQRSVHESNTAGRISTKFSLLLQPVLGALSYRIFWPSLTCTGCKYKQKKDFLGLSIMLLYSNKTCTSYLEHGKIAASSFSLPWRLKICQLFSRGHLFQESWVLSLATGVKWVWSKLIRVILTPHQWLLKLWACKPHLANVVSGGTLIGVLMGNFLQF